MSREAVGNQRLVSATDEATAGSTALSAESLPHATGMKDFLKPTGWDDGMMERLDEHDDMMIHDEHMDDEILLKILDVK